MKGNLELTKFLIENGININQNSDGNGDTPLANATTEI